MSNEIEIDLSDLDDFEISPPKRLKKIPAKIVSKKGKTPESPKEDSTVDKILESTPSEIATIDLTEDKIKEGSPGKSQDTSPFKCKILI